MMDRREYTITTMRLAHMVELANTPEPRGVFCEVCEGGQAHYPHCSEWTPNKRGLKLRVIDVDSSIPGRASTGERA
jgi:hypothetical protein